MKKVARHKLVISRQSCNHFDTNVRHWSEQANWNVAQINEWWFTQLISAPDAIVKNLSAVFMMHSALPRQSWSKRFAPSFTSASPCWPITPFNTSASFPTFELKSPKCTQETFVSTLKSTDVSVCFRGISRLPSAFVFLRRFKLAHISIQVFTFHDGCKQGIDQQIFNRNRFHVKLPILSPENCKQSLQVKSWKAEVTAEKKQTQDYNQNLVTQAQKS